MSRQDVIDVPSLSKPIDLTNVQDGLSRSDLGTLVPCLREGMRYELEPANLVQTKIINSVQDVVVGHLGKGFNS